ncbi:MAG: nucleotidyltransferase domain-containing protein [Candidatus Geothermarchaeales archaeon]
MQLIELFRRVDRERREAYHRYLEKLRGKGVTVVLFGSRVRGDHHLHSDYDLLVISKKMLDVSPSNLEPALTATTLNLTLQQLEEKIHSSPLVLSAVLNGKIVLDELDLQLTLQELKKDAKAMGGEVTREYIRLPRNTN